jgi:hypothetical protein
MPGVKIWYKEIGYTHCGYCSDASDYKPYITFSKRGDSIDETDYIINKDRLIDFFQKTPFFTKYRLCSSCTSGYCSSGPEKYIITKVKVILPAEGRKKKYTDP